MNQNTPFPVQNEIRFLALLDKCKKYILKMIESMFFNSYLYHAAKSSRKPGTGTSCQPEVIIPQYSKNCGSCSSVHFDSNPEEVHTIFR